MFIYPFALFVICVISALCLSSVSSAIPADLITDLPGFGNGVTPTKQYSGMMSIDHVGHKYLHYWFVESSSTAAPSTIPVMLWFNGGPGCSSLDGFMYEHGPFKFVNPEVLVKTATGESVPQLAVNPYSWNTQAHMIYLESPVGVGYSYSTDSNDYNTNDTQTAADAYQFIVNFFAAYPEYASNPFYISGESYAGVYVPTLAALVLTNNGIAGNPNIPLKGIAVGNGCTGNSVGSCSGLGTSILMDAMHGHGLYSEVSYQQMLAQCPDVNNPNAACQNVLNQISYEVGNINIYDIYDVCINGPMAKSVNGTAATHHSLRAPAPHLKRMGRAASGVAGPVECLDGIAASAYLNSPSVQAAIHVPSTITWYLCTSAINYNSNTVSVLPLYQNQLIPNIRVLIFNGDADLCVPYLDNQQWTSSLNFPVRSPWAPWTINSQVQGYITDYEVDTQFTFITIKGSGHMVSQFTPVPALYFITQFLNNQPIAKKQ